MNKKDVIREALIIMERSRIAIIDSMPDVDFAYSKSFLQTVEEMKIKSEKTSKKACLSSKRIVALIAAALLAVSLITACSYAPARDFIIRFFKGEVNFSVSENTAEDASVADFALSKLPEGFYLVERADLSIVTKLVYTNGTDNIYFNYSSESTSVSVDNSDDQCETVEVGEVTVNLAYNQGCYTAVWKNCGYTFVLDVHTAIEKEEILEMVEGVAKLAGVKPVEAAK